MRLDSQPRPTARVRARVQALRPQLGHAARVAVSATAVMALVYVASVGVADAFLFRRVLWEVDSRLNQQLAAATRLADPRTAVLAPDDQGTDGAPVILWWVPDHGRSRAISSGAGRLPAPATAALRVRPGVAVTIDNSRYESELVHGGRVIAVQNLAGPSHVDGVLVTAELITAPVLLGAIFLGVTIIALEAVEPVERARRRQLEFTADASHELRTPLTVIEAEVELALGGLAGDEAPGLAGPVDESEHRDALKRVATESRRLRRIVDDLLWLARFDSIPLDPDGEPADLGSIVATCADRFDSVARTRGQKLVVERPPGTVLAVDAAADWLDRLVGTLLDNACRYAPAGGTVRISVSERAGRVLLSVEDDGPGITQAERAVLFDRFRRSSSTPGGAGLGLAIADSVVRRSRGRWRVGGSALGGAAMEVSWRRGSGAGRDPLQRSGGSTRSESADRHAGAAAAVGNGVGDIGASDVVEASGEAAMWPGASVDRGADQTLQTPLRKRE